MGTLYHFACQHSAHDIAADNLMLRPSTVTWERYDLAIVNRLRQLRFASGFAPGTPTVLWLTDDPHPTREALGLVRMEAHGSTCDRMAYRFSVDADSPRNEHKVMPWRTFWALYLPNPEWRMNLEYGRDAASWWVAVKPVQAEEGGPYEQATTQPVPDSTNAG